jgi:hypothetical protein
MLLGKRAMDFKDSESHPNRKSSSDSLSQRSCSFQSQATESLLLDAGHVRDDGFHLRLGCVRRTQSVRLMTATHTRPSAMHKGDSVGRRSELRAKNSAPCARLGRLSTSTVACRTSVYRIPSVGFPDGAEDRTRDPLRHPGCSAGRCCDVRDDLGGRALHFISLSQLRPPVSPHRLTSLD